ncbi:MAG: mechanosensitive ion channel family protein [Sphingomonadaceae bacterium]
MFDHLNPSHWSLDWSVLAESAIVLAIAVAIALLLHRVLFALFHKIAAASSTPLDEMVFSRIRGPILWTMIAIAISAASQAVPFLARIWAAMSSFVVPALLGWIAYTLVKAFAYGAEYQAEVSSDPVASRSRMTRIAILSRTATFGIVFITVGLMLLGIPVVRDIGVTLMASAGLAALAVGAAAQPALKSLIAGLQMALTEPLRIGDLVVVDGHTGRVEEILMSYVVVRIWDERVVIVPTSRFLENTFENWSRKNEKLTGPVFLNLDPVTDVAPLRAEFLRFVSTQPKWDHRTANVMMTDAYPESIELRLSMSAATIGDLFDLRCAVREHMLGWLRNEMPEALIRHRLEVGAANERGAQGR